MAETVARLDRRAAAWMARHGRTIARLSLAIVFIWFGILKPLGASPAAELVARTVPFLPPEFFVPFLGWWEVAIGLCLLHRRTVRVGLLLLAPQMAGTFLPLVLLPEVCYTAFPFALTLEGQYIVKNLTLISAAIVVGGSLAAGRAPATGRTTLTASQRRRAVAA